jgi:ribose transport system permease protein
MALISGMAFGATNAILVTRLHVNSFIATLATTGIGTGIALVITNGIDVAYVPPALQSDFSGVKLLGLVPEPVMLPVVIIPILWYLLNRTRFGVHTQALGSSRLAATRAGIDAPRHILKLFMLMGVMAALAGLVDVSRFGTTSVSAHTSDALAAIAACVIGGTSLYGGRASIGGSTIGTFIPVVLASGLIIVGVTSFYQLIAVGVILIVAVNIDQRRHTASN